jgi:soluble lytic murein transglycosylase
MKQTIIMVLMLILVSYSIPYKDIYNYSAKLSKKFDMPQDIIIAVARAESDFNQNKVSKAGAVGVMQIMPICYKHYKSWYPRTVITNFDVLKNSWKLNMTVGTWYLKKICYRKYKNWKLAIMAYFAGPWNKKLQTYGYYAYVVRKSKLKLPIID